MVVHVTGREHIDWALHQPDSLVSIEVSLSMKLLPDA